MNDNWSNFNEVVQNLLGLSVMLTYLYMTIAGLETPLELKTFAGAILIYFGFKLRKTGKET